MPTIALYTRSFDYEWIDYQGQRVWARTVTFSRYGRKTQRFACGLSGDLFRLSKAGRWVRTEPSRAVSSFFVS